MTGTVEKSSPYIYVHYFWHFQTSAQNKESPIGQKTPNLVTLRDKRFKLEFCLLHF
jgi:hypothetical protein